MSKHGRFISSYYYYLIEFNVYPRRRLVPMGHGPDRQTEPQSGTRPIQKLMCSSTYVTNQHIKVHHTTDPAGGRPLELGAGSVGLELEDGLDLDLGVGRGGSETPRKNIRAHIWPYTWAALDAVSRPSITRPSAIHRMPIYTYITPIFKSYSPQPWSP